MYAYECVALSTQHTKKNGICEYSVNFWPHFWHYTIVLSIHTKMCIEKTTIKQFAISFVDCHAEEEKN